MKNVYSFWRGRQTHRVSHARGIGISRCGDHSRHRVRRVPLDWTGITDGIAARNAVQHFEKRAFHQRENRFRLRITKPTVELDHAGTIAGQHQSRVEQSLERTARFTERRERWQKYSLGYFFNQMRRRR